MRLELVRKTLRKIGINITLSRPLLDLDLDYSDESLTTNVIIKNAGNQAAFNVYFVIYDAEGQTQRIELICENASVCASLLDDFAVSIKRSDTDYAATLRSR